MTPSPLLSSLLKARWTSSFRSRDMGGWQHGACCDINEYAGGREGGGGGGGMRVG